MYTTEVKVAVVDDNLDCASSTRDLLELWGFEVKSAYDGKAALDLAREFHPDVMLLDIGLPNVDGYEVARQLRSDPIHNSMVLVAISGYGQPEDREKAYASGFDYHFTKPANMNAIKYILQHVDHVENSN